MTTKVGRLVPGTGPRISLMAMFAALAVLVAACGGGNGGGGGGEGGGTLVLAFVNETAAEATVAIDDGEPVSVESCKGQRMELSIPDGDWVLNVNGQPAIDTLEQDAASLGQNMVAEVWIHEDDSIEVVSFSRGSNIMAPNSFMICT